MTQSVEKKEKLHVPAGTYALFTLITLGTALGNMSQTGINAMMPAITETFFIGLEIAQWLSSGYMMVVGVTMPFATYLQEKLTYKSYLLISLGAFAFGALLSYLAPSFAVLLIGRLIQAVAAGLLIPLLNAVAITCFPPGYQATAMGVAGMALGFAPSFGPTLGGIMDNAFGWRSFFLLLALLTFVLFILTFILIRSEVARGGEVHFEKVSFVLSTLGFGGLLLGLSQASSYGFFSLWVWIPLALGVFFVVLFIQRQRKLPEPFMDLRIFKSRHFRVGLIASVFLFANFMGITLVIPLYVQNVLGGTSLDAGLVLLPATVTSVIFNPVSGIMADKIGMRFTTILFSCCLFAGSIGCGLIGFYSNLQLLSVFQTVRSIGVSGLVGPLMTYTLDKLQGPLVPHGSSAASLIRQIAGTLGLAIMVFCVMSCMPYVGTEILGIGIAAPSFPYQVALDFSSLMGLGCLVTVLLKVKDSAPR